MVLGKTFQCPVNVIENQPYYEALKPLLQNKPWALITSHGWVKRGLIEKLKKECGEPSSIISNVPENPKYSDIKELTRKLNNEDIVVAVGGGSVIDITKGIVAYNSIDQNDELMLAHLVEGQTLPDDMINKKIIAIPTTSGTGSEVTRWGTIWGDDAIKYSVNNNKLFPSVAILDPLLCTSMPEALTLATALDSLSHAMESVWNKSHTHLTDTLARTSIRILRQSLPKVISEPENIKFRQEVQTAALLSGLTMSTTQTALAHSISYPFTAHYGMPHGFACSFTLAEVARFNIESDPDRLQPIAEGLSCNVNDIPQVIEEWLIELDIGKEISKYVTTDTGNELGDKLITRARAKNNLREVDSIQARQIVNAALKNNITH